MLPPYHLFFFSPQTIDRAARRGRLPAAPDHLRRRRRHAAGRSRPTRGRRLATLLGLGNVMTVYASREPPPLPPPSLPRRIDARYRPAPAGVPRLARLARHGAARAPCSAGTRAARRAGRRSRASSRPGSGSTPTDRWRSSAAGNHARSSPISTGAPSAGAAAPRRAEAAERAHRPARRAHVVRDDGAAGRQHAPHLGGDRAPDVVIEHRAQARELRDQAERLVRPRQAGRVARPPAPAADSARAPTAIRSSIEVDPGAPPRHRSPASRPRK